MTDNSIHSKHKWKVLLATMAAIAFLLSFSIRFNPTILDYLDHLANKQQSKSIEASVYKYDLYNKFRRDNYVFFSIFYYHNNEEFDPVKYEPEEGDMSFMGAFGLFFNFVDETSIDH